MIAAILGQIWPYLAGALGFVALWWGRYALGKRKGRQETALQAAEKITKTHGRMNNADLGTGATDADRIVRLRKMADDLSKRHGG